LPLPDHGLIFLPANPQRAEQLPEIRMDRFSGLQQPEVMTGHRDLARKLVGAGLRATRQRLALADLMFSRGDRHISAEILQAEARAAGFHVSLATIYNTLHQFSAAGLLRTIAIDTTRTYFDTNTGNHQHFFIEETCEVVDIDDSNLEIGNLPTPPQGYEISRVDVVVRLKPAKTV
jgi:Fur family iron response transcriptional regulator